MNQNTEYEKFAQEVYQGLINAQGIETINVQHNVKLTGKSGQPHQIDVYWEYEIVGVKHKVAIECKNYNRNVSNDKVNAFCTVLDDLADVKGIMVTKVGYQAGAKKIAERYGVDLKELRTPNDLDWQGRVKKINVKLTMVLPNIKQCVPILDEEWIKINIKLPKDGQRTYQLRCQGMADEIIIYDAKGVQITNFYELENKLPCLDKEVAKDYEHIYPFDDAYMDLEPFGRVKINGVKYVYDVAHQNNEFTIDAQETVKAILKDALNGEIKFISKNE